MNRQTRKRLATRQRISDAATSLFFKHGFDQVTFDGIAEAADVSRMTVFNHFARKEDMFFDLDPEGRENVLAALREKDSATSPVDALRVWAHRAIAEESPYVNFFHTGSERFIATIRASEALLARTRAIREELCDALAVAMAESVNLRAPDTDASLAASLLLATWTVALSEGYRVYEQNRDAEKAKEMCLGIIDRGTQGMQAALAGTPYV